MNEYNIAIMKKMKVKDIPKYLTKLFKSYKGNLLLPTKMTIGSSKVPIEVDISNLDFKKFSKFFDRYFVSIYLQFKSAYSMWIRVFKREEVWQKKDTKLIIINVEANHALFDSEEYSKEQIEKHWREIDEFGLLLAKVFGVEMVAGGSEVTTPEPEAGPINYVCSKGDKYLDFLGKHIKLKFNLDLSKEKIKEIVAETADYIEEKDGYTLVVLRKLPEDYPNREEITYGFEGSTDFYQTIRKLKEAKSK